MATPGQIMMATLSIPVEGIVGGAAGVDTKYDAIITYVAENMPENESRNPMNIARRVLVSTSETSLKSNEDAGIDINIIKPIVLAMPGK